MNIVEYKKERVKEYFNKLKEENLHWKLTTYYNLNSTTTCVLIPFEYTTINSIIYTKKFMPRRKMDISASIFIIDNNVVTIANTCDQIDSFGIFIFRQFMDYFNNQIEENIRETSIEVTKDIFSIMELHKPKRRLLLTPDELRYSGIL